MSHRNQIGSNLVILNQISLSEIYQQLEGKWKFHKLLNSKLISAPSGYVQGDIEFKKYIHHDQSLLCSYDYIYIENGVFQTSTGSSFDVTSSYIYSLNTENSTLDLYFPPEKIYDEVQDNVKHPHRGKLFVKLPLSEDGGNLSTTNARELSATCDHECGKDMYYSSFKFSLDDSIIKDIEIKYIVKGPFKDYESVTTIFKS